jgi:hypothetical protein
MVEIRLAVPADVLDLIELRHEYALLQRLRLTPASRDSWLSEMLGWLVDAQSVVCVALNNGQVIGYIVGQLQSLPSDFNPEHHGVISELVLDIHQYQGGVARLLVDAVRQWCKTQSVECMTVSASTRLPVEQAFWRALGALEWMGDLWIK